MQSIDNDIPLAKLAIAHNGRRPNRPEIASGQNQIFAHKVLGSVPAEEREVLIKIENMATEAFTKVHNKNLEDADALFTEAWKIYDGIDKEALCHRYAYCILISRTSFLWFKSGDYEKAYEGMTRAYENMRECEVFYQCEMCHTHAIQIIVHMFELEVARNNELGVLRLALGLAEFMLRGQSVHLDSLPSPWNRGWNGERKLLPSAKSFLLDAAYSAIAIHIERLEAKPGGRDDVSALLSKSKPPTHQDHLAEWFDYFYKSRGRCLKQKMAAAIDFMLLDPFAHKTVLHMHAAEMIHAILRERHFLVPFSDMR